MIEKLISVQTGMNAATAVVNQLSASSLFKNNPMIQKNQINQYNYD